MRLDGEDTRNTRKSKLTERESEVLRLVVEGKSNSEIASRLFVSTHSAKAHFELKERGERPSFFKKLTID